MKRFENKVVVITGASRGLGAASARRFAEEGASVVVNYVSNESEATEVARELEKEGARTLLVQADVGNEADVLSMVEKVTAVFGKIDFLVNNAGIVVDKPFLEKTTHEWQHTLDVNLNGVYYCTKHFMPYMNKGGSVVNISSTNGIDTFHPDSIDYDVSKAGVIMFTKAMARDLAPNVRINSVAPGWFDTDINAELPEDYVKKEAEKIAMGRFGKPGEIAGIVAFLCSTDASFITGSVIVADGGYGGAV